MNKTALFPLGTQNPPAPFSPGIRVGNTIYVSGILPFDSDYNIVHAGDAAAQTRHVLETIKAVVTAGGGTMEDICFNSIFLSDFSHYAALNRVYAEFFPGDKPARYCIQCGLARPDALVEISSIAHLAG